MGLTEPCDSLLSLQGEGQDFGVRSVERWEERGYELASLRVMDCHEQTSKILFRDNIEKFIHVYYFNCPEIFEFYKVRVS